MNGPGWIDRTPRNLPPTREPLPEPRGFIGKFPLPCPLRPNLPENHPNFSDFSSVFAGFFLVFSAFSRKLFPIFLDYLSGYFRVISSQFRVYFLTFLAFSR